MRALITGISGFVGSHLAHRLYSAGWQVSGFDLHPASVSIGDFHQGELTDHAAVKRALEATKPDVIFHLAGIIKSTDAEFLYRANLMGTVALLDQVIESGLRPTVVVASSSAVYGHRSGAKPISERMPRHPVTHYAVSKVAQEAAALRYYESFHLPVKVVRMFNLLGPGQSASLACSAFAHQIALAEAGGENKIATGNLDARRDFVDVRDAARAFILTAEKGTSGQVYNVCSGRAVSIQKCLDIMLAMSSQRIETWIDAARVHKHDVPIQIGNFQKIKKITGWTPKITLKQSLADLLNDWRQRVKSELE